ncbi:FAD-dependent oxidoreductase [Nocardia tengchongensis]|uniref:FAD-dependent oxidoreductase n=1 Tax=Nocardia tengchongensis TaxID=2055889 RepID=UPI0036BB0E6D
MALTRRGFVAATALAGATSALSAALAGPDCPHAQAEPASMVPGGADYLQLTHRGHNRRFVARPERIHVPSTAEEVRDAVATAVRDRARIAVRAGGHCFEDFVDSEDTRVLIDLQRLSAVDWDDQHRAFSVGAGADLDAVYRGLAHWGVTVPGGLCRAVGAGGHISGGGFGPLSRMFGLVVDHLYGVEVVTVDSSGRASVTLATKDGPNRDLWWGHTGGGGGNFGVVTRFLLRSTSSDGAAPALALPRQPAAVVVGRLLVPMPMVTEDSFLRLMGNYLDFYSRNRDPGNRFAGLYGRLMLRRLTESFVDLLILSHGEAGEAHARLDEFLAAVTEGVTPAPVILPRAQLDYAASIEGYYAQSPVNPSRIKIKSALLRQPYSADQLRALYRALVEPVVNIDSFVEFSPFGGAINATAPGATAMPGRDSFMKMLIHAAWDDPGHDDRFLAWTRATYRELYADTGAAPVPNARTGGAYINYPDADLADPAFNTSAVDWPLFYYGDGYPRLRRIKSEWDPGNVFRHRLSIQPQ